MNIREKGLSVSIDTHSGRIHLRYMYPISANFYNVFTAGQEAFGYKVVRIDKKDKTARYFCELIVSGTSDEVFPKFRKVQSNLMMMSRRAKVNVLNSDIERLEQVSDSYKDIKIEPVLEPVF